jgi:hypothetical protein
VSLAKKIINTGEFFDMIHYWLLWLDTLRRERINLDIIIRKKWGKPFAGVLQDLD